MPDKSILEGSVKMMLGRIDERTQALMESDKNILKSLKTLESRMNNLESHECPLHDQLHTDVIQLKIDQEKIIKESAVADEKIKSDVRNNSIRTSGITTLVLIILNYIFGLN